MKILFATDGSAHSKLAEILISRIPLARGSEVTCAHAVAPPYGAAGIAPPFGTPMIGAQSVELWQMSKQIGGEIAQAAADRLATKGFRTEAVVLEGDVGNAILDFAEEGDFDLVVVGSRGEGAFKSFFLGSVARKLLGHCTRSLLVARSGPDREADDAITELKESERLRVLVAVDGSPGAERALKWVASNGQNAFDWVGAIAIHPFVLVPVGVEPHVFKDTYDADEKRAQDIIAHAKEVLEGIAPQTQGIVRMTRPGRGILEAAKEHGADLVVLSATRHGAIERFLIGSVSYEVATEAPCSVLVIRHRNHEG